MLKYAKIIDKETGLCSVGIKTNEKTYQSFGMTKLDVKQSDIDDCWYLTEKCPMKTDEEREKERRQTRIAEIRVALIELDSKTIRPLRAGETEKLQELEEEAEALRAELQELEGEINDD